MPARHVHRDKEMKSRAVTARTMRDRFLSHHWLFLRACRFSSRLCCLASQLFLFLNRERNFGNTESQANQDKQSNPTPRMVNMNSAQPPYQKPRDKMGTLAKSRVMASMPMNTLNNTELTSSEGSRSDLGSSSVTTSSQGWNSRTIFCPLKRGCCRSEVVEKGDE